jgi:predicted hydrocarbon binding protein
LQFKTESLKIMFNERLRAHFPRVSTGTHYFCRTYHLRKRGASMKENRKYRFSWDLLGDIKLGRPNLGPNARLEVYRLMQFSFRDVIEQQYGSKAADAVFYKAGYLAGKEFYKNVVGETANLNEFVKKLQTVLRELGIGILRIEVADLEKGRLVITISEDLDCSGLPEKGYEICTYDEGFIAALLKSFTGKKFVVKEVDCWCTGDRTCRFEALAQV